MSVDPQAGLAVPNLVIEDSATSTGIDEAMVETLVRAFYGRVRHDPLIGPVFESKIQDWEEHIGRLCTFWSSVALGSSRYRGQPMVCELLGCDVPVVLAGMGGSRDQNWWPP
jgi:truncated hemoglobin YjbI